MRTRLPGALVAAFVYWCLAILHRYYGLHPFTSVDVSRAFRPSVPPEAFSWEHLAAFAVRAASGHGAAAAWMLAVLGVGLAAAAWIRSGPGADEGDGRGPERLAIAFGLGLAAGGAAGLGLGLVGLWLGSVARAGLLVGLVLLVLESRRRSVILGAGGATWVVAAGLAPVVALGAVASWAALSGRHPEIGRAAALPALAIAGSWAAWWWRRVPALAAGEPSGSLGLRALAGAFAAQIGLAWLVVASVGLTPERFYDAQVYHLALPELFAHHHRVVGVPQMLHASFPLGMQVHYGWLWLLEGEAAVRAWRSWLFGLIGFATWRLAARAGAGRVGVLGAAAFAACPVLLLNAVQTSVDVEVGLMILLAALAATGRRLTATAALAGGALAMKPTAVFWLPFLAWRTAGRNPRRWAVFAAVAGLLVVPWLARTAQVTANPVYPYATSLFSEGRQMEPERREVFRRQASTYVVNAPGDLWLFPWHVSKGRTSETFIGPAFLLLLPLVLALGWRSRPARFLGALGGGAFALWALGTHVHRFLLPTWGMLGLFAVWSVREAGAVRASLRWVGEGVLCAVGLANLGMALVALRLALDPVPWLLGRESSPAYLERKMVNAYTGIALGAGGEVPGLRRVLLVGETRSLYWPVPVIGHSAFDLQEFERIVRASSSGGEAVKRLRQTGATHVFVNDAEASRLRHRFGYPMLEFTPAQRRVAAELWDVWMRDASLLPARMGLYEVRRAPRPAGEPAATPPLVFDPERLRRTFEGYAVITWEGGGQIRASREVSHR